MGLLRRGLGVEELRAEADIRVPFEDDDVIVENELVQLNQQYDDNERDSEELAQALEGAEDYLDSLGEVVRCGTCSQETYRDLVLPIAEILKPFGYRNSKLGLENHTDIAEAHVLAQESFGEFMTRLIQYNDMAMHWFGGISVALNTATKKALEYKNDLQTKAKTTYPEKRVIPTTNVNLWYHLTSNKGQLKDVYKEVMDDMHFSTLILDTYASTIFKQIQSIPGMLTGSVTSYADLKKIMDKMGKFKTSDDFFDDKDMREPILFGMNSLVKHPSKYNSKPTSDNGNSVLERVTTAPIVRMSTALTFSAFKAAAGVLVGTGFLGMAINIALPKRVEITGGDVNRLFKDAQRYADNVIKYEIMVKQIESIVRSIDSGFKSMARGLDKAPKNETSDIKIALRDIDVAIQRQLAMFRTPCVDEVSRSVKTLRYLNLLGNYIAVGNAFK